MRDISLEVIRSVSCRDGAKGLAWNVGYAGQISGDDYHPEQSLTRIGLLGQ